MSDQANTANCVCGYPWSKEPHLKWCGQCGAKRPELKPVVSEDDLVALEIVNASREAGGYPRVGALACCSSAVVEAARLAVRRVRDLLGKEAAALRAGMATARDRLRATEDALERVRVEREAQRSRAAKAENAAPLVHHKIEGLRLLKDDWDSYGGKAPTKAAIDTAKALIGDVHVAPVASGGVQIEVGDEIVEVGPDGLIVSAEEAQEPAKPSGLPAVGSIENPKYLHMLALSPATLEQLRAWADLRNTPGIFDPPLTLPMRLALDEMAAKVLPLASGQPSAQSAQPTLSALVNVVKDGWDCCGGRELSDLMGRLDLALKEMAAKVLAQASVQPSAQEKCDPAQPRTGKRAHLAAAPGVMGGKWRIVGTHIAVDAIKACAQQGLSVERIHSLYPNVEREDIEAALAWAGTSALFCSHPWGKLEAAAAKCGECGQILDEQWTQFTDS